MRNVMKRAHELAKGFVGHYAARLVIALRQAWKEVKKMKPSKETVFEMVRKTKAAAALYHNLVAQADSSAAVPAKLSMEIEKAGYKASEYNKELKAALALFTEEERNEMRNEFAK